jgi:phage/plasmid primase-like uncharacterized protein
MGAEARDAVDQERLKALAYSLGLSVHALTTLGIGWSTLHLAWSFPMTDATGNVVGIRLRRPNGFKFAVTGSREGLFLATADATDPRLVICEGPTDTAALVCLGFRRIAGRPSCNGGLRLVIQLCQRHRPTEVVIVADADEPGQRGADNLASALLAYVPTVRGITPPAGIKDARAWLQAGGTRDDVERAIEAAAERRLSMRVVPPRGGRHYER